MSICSRTGPSKILAASSKWIPRFVTLAAFFAASHSNPGGIVGHLFLLRPLFGASGDVCTYCIYTTDAERAIKPAGRRRAIALLPSPLPHSAKRNGKRERPQRA